MAWFHPMHRMTCDSRGCAAASVSSARHVACVAASATNQWKSKFNGRRIRVQCVSRHDAGQAQHEQQQLTTDAAISALQPGLADNLPDNAASNQAEQGYEAQQQQQQEQQQRQQDQEQQLQQQQQQEEQPLQQQEQQHESEEQEQQPEGESASSTQQRVMYSFFLKQESGPVPVQLPPPGSTPEPLADKPLWLKSRYKAPSFLNYFPPGESGTYNCLSFMGPSDPHGGKFLAPINAMEQFIESYVNTACFTKRKLYLAQCYQEMPFKYFQELDFPWDIDVDLVLELIPQVIDIVTSETSRVHELTCQKEPVISMRTPYKVHLNYPTIFTVEATARTVRKNIINRCRTELSGQPPLALLKEELQLQQQVHEAQAALRKLQQVVQQLQDSGRNVGQVAMQLLQELQPDSEQQQQQQQPPQLEQQLDQQPAATDTGSAAAAAAAAEPVAGSSGALAEPAAAEQRSSSSHTVADLDWESIIDFPHGSLRMLGSHKAPWMDSDPAWVTEKCYSEVKCVDGVWVRYPLTVQAVSNCSILLTATELRVFEQSQDFLEAAYQAADSREQLLAAKRLIRSTNKEIQRLIKLQQSGQATATAAAGASSQPEQIDEQELLRRQQQKRAQKERAAQLRREQQQAAAAAELAQQKKKEEALARLKAAAAAPAAASAQPALSRPPPLMRPGHLVRPQPPPQAPGQQQQQQQ